MVEVYKNIFIGSTEDFIDGKPYEHCAIIHACKTAHQIAVGYTGNLPSDDPNYLIYEEENELYMNLINTYETKYINIDLMHYGVNYAASALKRGLKVYIHDDQGTSRTPMIALLTMKVLGKLEDKNFTEALCELRMVYPKLYIDTGICHFAEEHWNDFGPDSFIDQGDKFDLN